MSQKMQRIMPRGPRALALAAGIVAAVFAIAPRLPAAEPAPAGMQITLHIDTLTGAMRFTGPGVLGTVQYVPEPALLGIPCMGGAILIPRRRLFRGRR